MTAPSEPVMNYVTMTFPDLNNYAGKRINSPKTSNLSISRRERMNADSRRNLTKTGDNDGDETRNYFQTSMSKNWKRN